MHLVPPAPKPPKTERQKILDKHAALVPAYMLKCPRCGGVEMVQTTIGVEVLSPGKTRGGTKQWVCFHCMARGERVACR